MQTKIIERYFFFALLFITFVFSFFIFKPFWIVLVLGACFSVLLYPVYKWFRKIRFPEWLASLFTVIFFLFILCVPIFIIGVIIFNQSVNVYNLVAVNIYGFPFLDSLNNSVNHVLPAGITFDLSQKLSGLLSLITDNVANVFTYTLSTIFSFFMILLAMFYFLKDGARWKEGLMVLSPLSREDDEKILGRLSDSINGIMKGYVLVSLIQGSIMGVGLAIFGVPNPAFWGLITMFTAFVPTIGTALVSVPIIIYFLFAGNWFTAIGLAIWAILIVGLVDNLINPLIVGRKIKLPPLVVLFAVLGGISLLGPVGILIGPLTVSLLYALISIYRNEFKQTTIL